MNYNSSQQYGVPNNNLYFENVSSIETFPSFHEHETIDIDVLSQEEHNQRKIIPRKVTPQSRDPTQPQWYRLPIEQIVQQCNTNIETGLSAEEAKQRLARDGKNELATRAKIRPIRILLHHTFAFMNVVLFFAAILSVVVQSWEDVGILAFIILFNILVGFIQEYRAEKTMQALLKLSAPTSQVRRNGQTQDIPSTEIVVGDIVLLSEGDFIPADMRVIKVSFLECNESALTGESVPVEKTTEPLKVSEIDAIPLGDQTNMVFMNTVVARGKGEAIVVVTGMKTEIGKIAGGLNKKERKTTKLQHQLNIMGIVLLIFAISCIGLVILGGYVYGTVPPYPQGLQVGISTAVAIIPEGLIPILTVTLTIGVRRLVKKHVLVRKMSALEDFGSVTDICSDKTGTITEGKMTAEALFTNALRYVITATGVAKYETPEQNLESHSDAVQLASIVASLCNGAEVSITENKETEFHGSPTEIALLQFAIKMGMSPDKLKQTNFPTLLHMFPFESVNKIMSVVYENSNGKILSFVKGAPEVVIPRCTHLIASDETEQPIKETDLNFLEMENKSMANEGLRVLALAYKVVDNSSMENVNQREVVENELIFIGYVGIRDPPRKHVAESVLICKRAGITVHMLTGDHISTATAIAKSVNIIDETNIDKNDVMLATEFDKLSKDQLSQIKIPLVVARCSPQTKVKIVEELHRRKRRVAMTGDGTNDALAIKKSDVGISMGINGSDVTKQASDLILTDDNFNSIVVGVEEGRRIFMSVLKFVVSLLSSNVGETIVIVIGIWSSLFPPLRPIQILWVNLVTGTPIALALQAEPAANDLMTEKMLYRQSLWRAETILDILVFGAFMGIICLANFCLVFFWLIEPLPVAQSITFGTLSFLLSFHGYNCRHQRKPFYANRFYKSYLLHLAVLFGVGSYISVLYIPWVNENIFHQLPWSPIYWLFIILGTVLFMVLCEVYKFAKRCVSTVYWIIVRKRQNQLVLKQGKNNNAIVGSTEVLPIYAVPE